MSLNFDEWFELYAMKDNRDEERQMVKNWLVGESFTNRDALVGLEMDDLISTNWPAGIKKSILTATKTLQVGSGPPHVEMRSRFLHNLVRSDLSFREILKDPLPFKIPCADIAICNQFPTIFEYGVSTEYGFVVDVFLHHRLLSLNSATAVVARDSEWQNMLKQIVEVEVFLEGRDLSNELPGLRSATGMLNNMLLWKCEAKMSLSAMVSNAGDLAKKLHQTAHKLFPHGCLEIPFWLSCDEEIHLYAIRYNLVARKYEQSIVKKYKVLGMAGRVSFISDLFKLAIWMLSQREPVEKYHLKPNVRQTTSNGHHVTLTEVGLVKEYASALSNVNLIKQLYELRLPNVDYGTTNCTSVTILRVGSQLRDVLTSRQLRRENVFEQVKLGVDQMHANGIAHCDICVDNIFVDSVEDGGKVFLGNVEHCQTVDDPPSMNLRRSVGQAKTAGDLDIFQLQKLKDDLQYAF